jgi:hypothetical protein
MLKAKRIGALAFARRTCLSTLSSAPSQALGFKQIPATHWGYVYAGTETAPSTQKTPAPKNLEAKSKV